jgi:flavin-dependent dehydrogenase
MDGRTSEMDVAVFGGGPAGLAAALALRQRGCRVGLFDGQHPPIDKACGEGLLPEAVDLLRALGVTLDQQDGAPLAGISFHDAQSSAYAAFGGGNGWGVRRTHLHARMVAQAAAAGIALHWGASVRREADGNFVSAGAAIPADFFVIADGLCSTLTAPCGFRERHCYSTRYASRQQFRCSPWSRMVEIHWRHREQLYITPLGDDEVGVTLLTAMRGRRLGDALLDFPAVANRLADAPRTSSIRGAVTQTRSLHEVIRGNVAVLGDASGSVDAVTGEGLLSALRQANALADAITASQPERYAAAHRQIAKAPQRMARLLLLLDHHSWLQRRFVATLQTRPETFAGLLRVHLREQSWRNFAWSEAAALLAGKCNTEHSTEHGAARWPHHAVGADRERGL